MYDITASIVIYENNKEDVSKLLSCLKNINLSAGIYVIDNSIYGRYSSLCNGERIEYIENASNPGYGAAHNCAIEKSINNSKYHLVLNPDVYFDDGTVEKLFSFMEKNRDVGLVMPKVLNPDGSVQYLCKLLPTPYDLLFRRFLPFSKLMEKRNRIYELRFTGYNKVMEVPYLSGCFMFLRTEALRKAGMFDERFFMYLEDTDLSRRIHAHYKTVYYPKAEIYHRYEKGSYKSMKLLKYHVVSAIRYFNKWGWFFDRERRKINGDILRKLQDTTD